MANIPIGGVLSTSADKPNIDARFGPFSSVQDAFSFIVNQNDRTIAGLHFGISNEDGTVSEYKWTKNNGTRTDYIEVDTQDSITVINNLTSSSTDAALSANQGKVLKSMINGKADTNHNHYIADIIGLQEALDNGGSNSSGSLTSKGWEREYNSSKPNLKGYKIVSSISSFASQVNKVNTIYEIREAFDLNNQTVSIPSGCTLRFKGGYLYNGKINCINTCIEGNDSCLDIEIIGTITNAKIPVSWFNTTSNKLSANVTAICNLNNAVILDVNKDVTLTGWVDVKRTLFEGKGTITSTAVFKVTDIIDVKDITISATNINPPFVFKSGENSENKITFKGVKYNGNSLNYGLLEVHNLSSKVNINIQNCELTGFIKEGIRCTSPNTSYIANNYLHDFGTFTAGVIGIILGNNPIEGVNLSEFSSIVNNTIKNIKCNYADGMDVREAHGILVYGNHNKISYNIVENIYCEYGDNAGTDTEGIYLKGAYNEISYNLVKYANGQGENYDCDGAIISKYAKYTKIHYNTVIAKYGTAIGLMSNYNCSIIGNTIYLENEATEGFNIYAGTEGSNSILENNYVESRNRAEGQRTKAFVLYNSYNFVCKNNITRNVLTALYDSSPQKAYTITFENNRCIFDNVDFDSEENNISVNSSNLSTLYIKGNTFEYTDSTFTSSTRFIKPESTSSKVFIDSNSFIFNTGTSGLEITCFIEKASHIKNNYFDIQEDVTINYLFNNLINAEIVNNVFNVPNNGSLPSLPSNAVKYNNRKEGVAEIGTTANRPASTDITEGFQYYDTTIKKPVWWNGSTWVNFN